MISLTDEMQQAIDVALAEGAPVIVASAGQAGEPDMAFKGSVMVFDREHLAFWERSHGTTLQNLTENPQVCLLYRNPARQLAWKFFGAAELHREGDLRRQVMERTVEAELNRDPERKGVAVLIRVDRVMRGREVIMSR